MALNIRSPLFGEHHTLWNAESQHWDFGSSDTDSYANVAYENVIESLQDIIRKEFHIPVFDEHRGNQSIVVDFVTDNFVEHFSSGQTRSYDVDIIYTLMRGGGWRNTKMQLISTAEHLKKLMYNNSNYSPSGVYKYHDGKVQSVEYEQDEDNLDLWRANVSFNCIVTEVNI